jgi:hypothetical protein
MQAYDFNLFPNDLQNWMMTRFLDPILSIEGGWEYWIQIDFPAWLDVNYNTQYDFRREVTGILPSGRLDWLVNSQGFGGQLTAVEIKAQTHKYQNTPFVQDVLKDIEKLSALDLSYTKIMLAAVIDNGAYSILTTQYGFAPIAQYNDTVKFLARGWS